MNMKLISLLCVSFLLIKICSGNDVLGCGGFIKSHAPIDFSKIEVILLTKQGSLKDSTFCAPNNGYYFLPLYDKGEYFLRINPPTGWSFMPKEVSLKVDGVSDLCSQSKDINFVFEGFGITGRVDNLGGAPGPKGIKIELTDGSEIRETFTNDEGTFYFTPVFPGTYTLTASHPKWTIKENKHTVQVASENKDLPKNTFLVIGYDVTGTVLFDKQPISKIDFILFSDGNQSIQFDKCNTAKHVDVSPTDKSYLCFVSSNEQGIFTFPQLSRGSYKLKPFYKKSNMIYHITPEILKFKVNRESLIISQLFEVESFTISGQVLTQENGQSIQGATIFVNDKPVTTTQLDGTFKLEKIHSGTYSIHIEASGLKFDKKTIKVNPNLDIYTKFYPSAFQVCGSVTSENSYTVIFTSTSNKEEFKVETNRGSGEFCTYLPTGNYIARVYLPKFEEIQFFPVTQKVQVISSPVSDINFSQLKATVTGFVKCLQASDCSTINIIMSHVSNDGLTKNNDYTATLVGNKFTFHNIITGTYQISLGVNKFCWKSEKHTIIVNSEITTVPDFIQTGYTIVFLSSHRSQIQYQPLTSSPEESPKPLRTIEILSGRNVYCVEKSGLYEFKINSCHLYENSLIKHNTSDESSEIYLTAIKHMTNVELTSAEKVSDLKISLTIENVTTKLGPLTPTLKKNMYHYKTSFHLRKKEKVILTPIAETLWFKPSNLTIIGAADCIDLGPKIVGLKGKVIQGQVLPPLAGVKITISESDKEILVRETDDEGKFKFPTLDDSHSYKVTAYKLSYTFTGPDEKGIIKAHKLAEIIVKAVDEKDETPLQGALISLSGGESYRSNLQTNSEGIINFSSLAPSDYFLRPMMKEYNFEPASKMISVQEGATIHIKLSGHRVAYSVYGTVTSLSGEPEDKMIVVADGIGSCSQYSEEATTEENGYFRIRGLHPHCKYHIKVKENLDVNHKIERAVPDFIPLQTNNEDIFDVKLIALRYIQHMDVLVQVVSSKMEYFKSLRLKLCKENNPNSPIFNVRLDPNIYKVSELPQPSVVVHLPSLPVDNKSYFLQLESTLSPSLHNYKTDVEYFVSNVSFKHFIMEFNPQAQVQEQDIAHTSVIALPFIFLITIALYNIQLITKVLSDILVERAVNNDEIDQLVQNINSVKRKIRPRKV